MVPRLREVCEQLKLAGKKVGVTTVVRLAGPRITEPVYISELSDELLAVLESAHPRDLLLDLDEVAYLSSSVLGKVLVRLLKRTRDMGGRLRLCGIRPSIHEVFEITRLVNEFEIYPDANEALSPAH